MALLSTLVMLVGVVMFFVPEPITSGLAILVILVGAAMRFLGGS